MKTKQVQFDVQDLLPIGITIGVLGVALSYMATLQSDIQTEVVADNQAANCGLNATGGTGGTIAYTACGTAYNVSADALEGTAKLSSNIPLIVGAVVIAVVIGILLRYFVFGGMNR